MRIGQVVDRLKSKPGCPMRFKLYNITDERIIASSVISKSNFELVGSDSEHQLV